MGLAMLDILSSLLAYQRSAGSDGWVRLPAREIGARALPRMGGVCLATLFAWKFHVPPGFDALDDRFYSIFLSQSLVDLLSVSIYTFQILSIPLRPVNSSSSSALVCKVPFLRHFPQENQRTQWAIALSMSYTSST